MSGTIQSDKLVSFHRRSCSDRESVERDVAVQSKCDTNFLAHEFFNHRILIPIERRADRILRYWGALVKVTTRNDRLGLIQ